MASNFVFALSAQILLIQAVFSRSFISGNSVVDNNIVIGNSGTAGYGFGNAGIGSAGISNFGVGSAGISNLGVGSAGISNFGIGSAGISNFGVGSAGIGNIAIGGINGLKIKSSGPLLVTSISPIGPSGLAVASENALKGNLIATGQLPFLSAVAFEDTLPTAGSGLATCGCGSGNVGIVNEGFAGKIGAGRGGILY